jgi:hypothetical protein
MTRALTLTVNLPFPGFYESAYSEAVDREESSWLEYHTEEQGETGRDYETHWPEPLRLVEGLWSLLNDATDYGAAYRQIARDYVAAFDYHAGEALGLTRRDTRKRYDRAAGNWTAEPYDRPSLGMTFESMDSPREYNFATDRVYADIPLKVMRDLLKRSTAEGHETLAQVIASRFTSRSGFASFYPSDCAAWLAKAGRLQDWDHNELGTLLIAGLTIAGADMESRDYWSGFAYEVRESAIGDDGAYQVWSDAVDWAKFDAARIEARAEKLAEWLDDDPDAARAWIAANGDDAATMGDAFAGLDLDGLDVTFRCPLTLDLFASPESVT